MSTNSKSPIADSTTSSAGTTTSNMKAFGQRSRIWRYPQTCRKGERKEEKVYDDYDEYDLRSFVWDSESNLIASCYHNQKLSHCKQISCSSSSKDESIPRDMCITDVEFRSYFIPLDGDFDGSVIYSEMEDDDYSLSSNDGNGDIFSDLESCFSYSDIDDDDYSFHSNTERRFKWVKPGDDETCSTASLTTASESTNHPKKSCNDYNSDGEDDDGDGDSGCFLSSSIKSILDAIGRICNQGGNTMPDSPLHANFNDFQRINCWP